MSKTVIVFSTRSIYPHSEDCLFSERQCQRKIFSHKDLADYFWNDIKQDEEHLKSLLTDDYFSNEKKQALVEFLDQHKEELEKVITKYELKQNYSTTDFEWIGDITNDSEIVYSDKEQLNTLSQDYFDSIDQATRIKTEDNLVLCGKLNNDVNAKQAPFNLDPEVDTQLYPGPWLHYRFSFYELNGRSDNIAIYAIWPLDNASPLNDGSSPWLEALTSQFLDLNSNAEELFLILHDNDIKDHTPFKVIIDDSVHGVARHVALFQHDSTDEIGSFISRAPNNCGPEEVSSFVEEKVTKARILKLLCDAYDYIINDDVDKLWGAAAELIKLDNDKFKCIYEIADKIEGGTPTATKQHLDQLKLELIQILNQKLREYMIIGES